MPNEDIAEMFLNLTEHPYAAVYSSSRVNKKTLTGEKRGCRSPSRPPSNSRRRANDY